jgi:predicted alpha/beta superfamily hydrolase
MKKGDTRAYTMFQTDAFPVDSAIMERRYDISVALPPSYHATDRRFPLLVVLDASMAFGTAVETARLLSIGERLTS